MNIQTQLRKKASAVKGLSIASIVFTILCLLSIVGLLASGDQVKSAFEDNKSGLTTSAGFSQNIGSAYLTQALFDTNINSDNADTAAIAKALKNSNDTNVAEFAKFLNMASTSDISGIYDFLKKYDYNQFIEMKHSVENLSDADIQALVGANSSITADQIKTLRNTVAQVPDDSLSFMSRYMGDNGSENLLNDSIDLIMAIYYGVLVALLIVNLFVLAACILGIMYSKRPKNNMVAFVFAIISAVLCFCEGAIVRCILFIISAVNMGQARKISKENNNINTPNANANLNGATNNQGGAAGAQPSSNEPSVFANVQ